MATIDSVTLQVADPATAETFYADAFDLGPLLQLSPSEAPTSGFRGFTMSLVVAQPSTADALISDARTAGATIIKPAAASLWGYGGVLQAPDGTLWTIASSAKKDTGPATRQVDSVVLQLGVSDVRASREFYAERGFTASKSFGRRYAEYDTGPITFTLNKRAALAKSAGVPVDGDGSHRLVVNSSLGPFTDPDGFSWQRPTR